VRVLDIVTRPQEVALVLDGASAQRVALVVHAEGALQPPAPGDVAQAVLADVQLEGLAPGVAVERFTRSGPLALLPLPGASTAMRSLVWCCDADLARRRMALDDPAFNAALQTELGTRIGRIVRTGPRRSFPLLHALRDEIRAHRSVWLGNAAQTLHPVAGQGLNLGLRDCATLADCLAEHSDVGAALQEYGRRRGRDRQAIAMLTRALPALFAPRFAPLALARSAGLAALDLAPPLRDALARLLIFGVRS
jgi:2-octaprenyl-6-methoxyphenol hydroxylase